MDLFLYWFPIGDFVIEFTIAVFLFMHPLYKRSNKRIQAIACFLAIIGIHIILNIYNRYPALLYLGLVLTILAGIGLFWNTVECTVWDGVFGVTCAYATQHLAYALGTILCTMLEISGYWSNFVHALVFAGIAVLCYNTVVLRISREGRYRTGYNDTVVSLVLLLVFAFLLNALTEQYYQPQNPDSRYMFIICKFFAIICCGYVLWIQTSIFEKMHVKNELLMQRQIWQLQRDQYELSKANIDLINQKCHDLKHQVHALRHISDDGYRKRVLEDIESSVMIYDSMAKTGNAVLDTIITERSLNCQKYGIEWTCMADASGLDFIDTIDLYTIMGNILDNAIECVRNLEDPDRRVISLNVQTREGIIIIRASNYYEQEIEMKEGFPQTNKPDKDYHGFGTKSISKTIEKYGGSVSYNTDNHIFTVCMIIPCASN